MATNLLYCTVNTEMTYELGFTTKSANISGKLVAVLDKAYDSGTIPGAVWADILKAAGTNDSIVYIIQCTNGSKAQTYIGKTLNTLAKRYAAGPKGGLKLIFDACKPTSLMSATLYNCSNPCLVEGWCFQVANDLKMDLANLADPS